MKFSPEMLEFEKVTSKVIVLTASGGVRLQSGIAPSRAAQQIGLKIKGAIVFAHTTRAKYNRTFSYTKHKMLYPVLQKMRM